MEISVISSWSNGNCCLVEDKYVSVLIDAWKSCREIETRMRRLGKNLVRACRSCNNPKWKKELDEWFSSDYCIKNNINKMTINPIVLELLKKQSEQKDIITFATSQKE